MRLSREDNLSLPKCGACGVLTRPMYLAGSGAGKNSRRQHPRWRVCGNGHKICVKRDAKVK